MSRRRLYERNRKEKSKIMKEEGENKQEKKEKKKKAIYDPSQSHVSGRVSKTQMRPAKPR
jgi:hypothetical protein